MITTTVHYAVRCTHSHRHFISFEAHFPTGGQDKLQLQLPAWRPGRYELGNFSKNIRGWKSTDTKGNELPFRKLNKDLWEVACSGAETVVIHYQYYAAELNAGSSFLDENMLYINPVNCFFYDKANEHSAFEVQFFLPEAYDIACGLFKKEDHLLCAANFDELADSPLIASASMKHLTYEVDHITYHIWIQGDVKLDEGRLVKEFKAFSESQVHLFGDIPCGEYHFLFHFTPSFVRHGVEHHNSTVIAMGPASEFQQEHLFKDLLGISCHELFHTWNIKNIRPIEMMPYDYTQENYSRLGYVAEGVTTYYGDILLWRTGSFDDSDWFDTVNETIQTHFDNPGRFNHSVADSSFDTWLDGYGAGIPWRKVSIYNEGCLAAMICDLSIIGASRGTRSLDNVMRIMYERFGKKQIGYSEADYRRVVEEVLGQKADDLFDRVINGKEDYAPFLAEALHAVGLEIHVLPAAKWSEAKFGFSIDETNQKAVINSVHPDTPADHAGLWTGDEILAVNGTTLYKNIQSLLKMNGGKEIQLTIARKNRVLNVAIKEDGFDHMHRYRLEYSANRDDEQKEMFQYWKNRA
jgi:predicted metalloprotease with PDZ domain